MADSENIHGVFKRFTKHVPRSNQAQYCRFYWFKTFLGSVVLLVENISAINAAVSKFKLVTQTDRQTDRQRRKRP